MFKYSTKHTAILQLLLPLAIYLGVEADAEMGWWLASAFFYTIVYVLIGNHIAMHRYFTHGYFTVTKPVQWLFVWASSMIGIGGPISYAITHIAHHKYHDTPKDPHGPIRGIRSWLLSYTLTPEPILSKHIFKLNMSYSWLHKYYLLFLAINVGIMWLISFKVFLFLWFIPASLACTSIAIAIWMQHKGLKPNNHTWAFLYEGLHKNHHDYPLLPNTAIGPNEIDWVYQFTKIFFPKYK